MNEMYQPQMPSDYFFYIFSRILLKKKKQQISITIQEPNLNMHLTMKHICTRSEKSFPKNRQTYHLQTPKLQITSAALSLTGIINKEQKIYCCENKSVVE